jgi:hypothetical protein
MAERLSFNEVINFIDSLGFNVLDDLYVNVDSDINVECKKCNFIFKRSLSNFKKRHFCKSCNILKKKKEKYAEIKLLVESKGYVLLSQDYIKNNSPLKLLCPEGHFWDVTWNNFRHSKMCGECCNNKKYTISAIKPVYIQNNCELLEDDYLNALQNLKFRCACGKSHSKSFYSFRKFPYCKDCSYKIRAENLKTDFEEIKLYIKNESYQLLSNEYLNANSKLHLKCPQGHNYYVSYQSFKVGHRCPTCQNLKKYSYDEVLKIFNSRGFVLLSKNYINSNTPLDYICSCGKQSSISLSNVKSGVSCKECGYEKIGDRCRTSPEDIINFFKQQKCEIIMPFTYKNTFTKIKYICKCGNSNEKSWASFKMGHYYCRICYSNDYSGKNAWNYNSNKTDEERIIDRSYPEYKKWIKEVYERDDFTCQCCGIRGAVLNAHHLDSYDWCITGRTDIDNGITLCKLCHDDFHSLYGKGQNTKEQFEEYMEDILSE